MARKQAKQTRAIGRLLGAAKAVKKMFTRGRDLTPSAEPAQSSAASNASTNDRAAAAPARVTRRQADIPLDLIGQTYTPPATSSKAGFRSDGSDHQRDQEFAMGVSDERWNDEDQFTNKSGDPRIGTHRRTYEPAEAGADSRE
ncbi:MAG: hypothetical protein ACJ74H_11070 [Thermoanaerobaculia bacterium]